jgi:hypothetical protein
MSTGSPQNVYACVAELTIGSSDEATAESRANAALAAINTALAGLDENVSISFGKDEESGQIAWAEVPDSDSLSVQGQLTVGATATSAAQSAAEDAEAAIATAISGLASGASVAVTLEKENGVYVFAEL